MSTSEPDHHVASRQLARGRRLLGALWLAVAAGGSLLLVLEHFGQLSLPYCRPQTGCAALTGGWAGKIADWPVSFFGLAFFSGLLLAWLTSPRQGFASGGKWLTRLGLFGSFWFVGVMHYEGLWCPWCIAVHAGNVLFWAVAETTPGVRHSRWPVVGFLATSLAMFAGLNVLNDQITETVATEEEVKLRDSIAEIIRESRSKPGVAVGGDEKGFIGRYARGGAKAPIRLVIFTDYECGYCQVLDHNLAAVLAGRDDVSYSVKHYPLCQACNPAIHDAKLHPNACRAARAAEAAGKLGGSDAFWAMHHWLIAWRGKFTEEQLREALPDLGIDKSDEFLRLMDSEEVRARVKSDIDEAISLEVYDTPRLFVNGVMLRGLAAPDVAPRFLAALSAADLPAHTAAADRPETTVDRLFAQWNKQPVVDIPATSRWGLGPSDAPIRVALFTDGLSEEGLAGTRSLLDAAAGRTDVRIECFHYPDAGYRYEVACLLEAAGQLAGNGRFWDVHKWLLTSSATSVEDVLRNSERLKMDPDQWRAELQKQSVRQIVDGDIALGAKLLATQQNVQKAPAMFVNGRLVPRLTPPRELLERIFGEASK